MVDQSAILTASHLTKRFGKLVAVNDISLSLNQGEILGLLGPNGAGKTTTLQMLLGILAPTSGRVHYFSKLLTEHRQEILEQVNFSSTYTNLPWNLTVQENLRWVSLLYELPDRRKRVSEIVEQFQLTSLLRQQVNELSSGQITRLNLAKAFINSPKILLLDEPTASLDPGSAQYIRDFLLAQREQRGISIIITSHNMAEVEQLADRVIFINHGRIIADDTPEALAASVDRCRLDLLVTAGQPQVESYCQSKSLPLFSRGHYQRIELPEQQVAVVLQDLTALGVAYSDIGIEQATLEDYFLEAVGERLPGEML